MPPTPQQITVALDALRTDADRWAEAAATMKTASASADGQRLDPAAFSFAGQAVAEAYEELRLKTVRLLTQGSARFEAIAWALRASADAYEADEAAGVHRMRNIY